MQRTADGGAAKRVARLGRKSASEAFGYTGLSEEGGYIGMDGELQILQKKELVADLVFATF